MKFEKSATQIAAEKRAARQNVREVLCRVFVNGADEGFEEWERWYDPTDWLHWSRALGAFIVTHLPRDAKYSIAPTPLAHREER